MAQHLSIRIPWKDNGYDGRVCSRPCYNNACLRLKNIAENKDDALEDKLRDCPILGHESEIPCLSEGGCFMSEDTYTKLTIHPYKKYKSGSHAHFLETELIYPPFSLPARPFGWTMLKKGDDKWGADIVQFSERFGIDYKPEREPDLSFHTNWVQDAVNQREIFKVFYQDVQPERSLVIPYAKQVPFIDDARRVVMGVGFVKGVIEPPEHRHTDDGTLRSILWETMIQHSIRKDRSNGFLLPYREMMEYADTHPDFDIRTITVFADDAYFNEFSFATEQLSYDAVIHTLLQVIKALNTIKECIPGNWEHCIRWTKERLNEVWRDRGSFPGLGAMLCAVGFKNGYIMANSIRKLHADDKPFEARVVDFLQNPPDGITVGKTELKAFMSLSPERQSLFWLLSRLSLTVEQAEVLFIPERRTKMRIMCSDRDMIENPYSIYENTRYCVDELKIDVTKIDMAVFPPAELRTETPVPPPSALESGNDERRIRALAVKELEIQSISGHTVYPVNKLIEHINELPLDPQCRVTSDVINSIMAFLSNEIVALQSKDGELLFQLKGLHEIDEVIRRSVDKRLDGERHEVLEKWRRLVDEDLGTFHDDPKEEAARTEKAAVLKELAETRISVLIGGAGTGKTTLLALLCKSPQIRDGGVLLLAPTGKARVKMEQAMSSRGINAKAMTVAQFLIQNDRYDFNTSRYHLSDKEADSVPYTVIIDECSMLTEEMLGALLQALRKAKRIILVGDPNQLPPIGAGRPFVDLVKRLQNDIAAFPRVGRSYGELTVARRQVATGSGEREDFALAQWFTNKSSDLDDSIFLDMQKGNVGDHIVFKQWNTPEELEQIILSTIEEVTGAQDMDKQMSFDLSVGGEIENGWMNFGKHPERVESWQILSAYRNNATIGTATINRYIHQRFRSSMPYSTDEYKRRSTPKLLGTEGIVYGDKVINVINGKRRAWPVENARNFVANGEIGIVERIWETKKGAKSNSHQIRFSSQPEHAYNWLSSISEENACELELAYALTVHKAQGSEFEKVILVLGEPSGLVTKELLYTAITRQKEKLVILYNDMAYKLRDYASSAHSEIARRFTCLFDSPNLTEYKHQLYEASLIHKTMRGEMVRSKSEVIIADSLFRSGIRYEYETELDLGEDGIRRPDFTVDDEESGRLFYWEHCGMMSDENYRKRWQAKKELYANHGIIEGENLIVSYDGINGSIDSSEIQRLIDQYLR